MFYIIKNRKDKKYRYITYNIYLQLNYTSEGNKVDSPGDRGSTLHHPGNIW